MTDHQKHTSPGKQKNKPEPEVPQDARVDQAVDDIMQHESDAVLELQDTAVAKTAGKNQPHSSLQKAKDLLNRWWDNTRVRYATIAGVVLVLIFLFAIPPSRDFALNLCGLRGSVSLTVLDGTTALPLDNVQVSLGNQTTKTDRHGVARIAHLKLGKQTLRLKKIAFATITQPVTIGLGNHNLGKLSLRAVGVQYHFTLTDYLSGKPVTSAETVSGEASAPTDQSGNVVLTVQPQTTTNLTVTFSASGYRDSALSIPVVSTGTTNVSLVPSGKEVFVSNANGTYNLYTSDIDGQNKQLLLAGTGKETSNIGLAVSTDGTEAAVVNTRDNIHDAGGYLLSTLTLINVNTTAMLTLDHAEQLQLIGWVANRVIFEETIAGASAANSQRERIISYDYVTNNRVQLMTANQFNVATLAAGLVYYAPASSDPSAQLGLYKIDPNGNSRQQLFNQEVWSAQRSNYTTFNLQTPQGWYSYTLGAKMSNQITTPTNLKSYSFTDNADGSSSLWTDLRDGQGLLLTHDVSKNTDAVVATLSGLGQPIRWLTGSVAIARVTTPTQTADFGVSLNGGTPKKITDVAAVNDLGSNY